MGQGFVEIIFKHRALSNVFNLIMSLRLSNVRDRRNGISEHYISVVQVTLSHWVLLSSANNVDRKGIAIF